MSLLTFVLLGSAFATSIVEEYPKKNLLVEAEQIAALQKEFGNKLRVLDVRPAADYEKGHLPGAIQVAIDGWSKSFGNGEDVPLWEKQLGAAGINSLKDPVLVYDDGTVTSGGRVWFILRYWGVEDVRFVNGGIKAIEAAKVPLTKVATIQPAISSTLKLTRKETRLIKLDQLQDLVTTKSSEQIVDARTDGEFTGTTKNAARGGTVPGCVHLDWQNLIDKESRKFKSAAELKKVFDAAGIDPKKPSVTFCQSGGRASVMAFALELMGGEAVRNYYKSWSEWGNSPTTPIEAGKIKK